MAKCESCPLYIGFTAANEVTGGFEHGAIDSAEKDGARLQKHTEMYVRIFQAVEKQITCNYDPNPKQSVQPEPTDTNFETDSELAITNSGGAMPESVESQLMKLIANSQQAPKACEVPFQVALQALMQNNEIKVYPTGHTDSVQNRQIAAGTPPINDTGHGQYL
jgi:hypothetical protein